MSINVIPGMQSSTKQFCWVYHLQKSQLKMTLLCLCLAMFFPMQIWDSFLNKNHLSCKQSQTLPFFGALWWIYLFQQLFEFFGGKVLLSRGVKIYKYGCNSEQVLNDIKFPIFQSEKFHVVGKNSTWTELYALRKGSSRPNDTYFT